MSTRRIDDETFEPIPRPEARSEEGEGARFEHPAFESFWERGLITGVAGVIKSGKEATVYACDAHPSTGVALMAAKVFRDAAHRSFRNDAAYRAGRLILDERAARAARKKTAFGRELLQADWTGYEAGALERLSRAGADVPRLHATAERALLMDLVTLDGDAAPRLAQVRFERPQAEAVLDRVLANVELMLALDMVHGDLSVFNVLWDGTRPVLIDFPQWIDPRLNRLGQGNRDARALLERDVANLCAHFEQRYGVRRHASSIVRQWWNLWERQLLWAEPPGGSLGG